MSLLRSLLVVGGSLVLLAACGGGGGGDDDDDGACRGSLKMEWPSEATPDFCALEWTSADPALLLTECGEVFENCSDTGTTPDFSCLDTTPDTPPATPATVTLTGWVDVFSSGPNANQARIQLFRHAALAAIADDAIDAAVPFTFVDVVLDDSTLAGARACPKEKDFMQGQCVVPTNNCGGQCDKVVNAGSFCFDTACVDLQRWEVQYSIPDVPTNEFLVIRTVGLDNSGDPQPDGNTWSPLIQYNNYLATNDRACADELDRDCIDTSGDPAVYQADVNLLSSQDYMTIPTAAGLSAGVPNGHGGFAGEVHDCNGVRVRHAQIGFELGREPTVLVYFNGNVVSTLPRLAQIFDGTNLLGLYSGLDITPGPVALVAIGNDAGTIREIGRFKARVWSNSVSTLRLNGGRPPLP